LAQQISLYLEGLIVWLAGAPEQWLLYLGRGRYLEPCRSLTGIQHFYCLRRWQETGHGAWSGPAFETGRHAPLTVKPIRPIPLSSRLSLACLKVQSADSADPRSSQIGLTAVANWKSMISSSITRLDMPMLLSMEMSLRRGHGD